MKLILTKLASPFDKRGIYGESKVVLADRMLYLHPEAAASLRRFEDDHPGMCFYSDVFRTAEASRRKRRKTRRAQPAGSSGHNYGLCKDHDVGANMRRLATTKREYDQLWAQYGWYCHRRDHALKPEAWHYNYLGSGIAAERWLMHARQSTAGAIEAKIQALYGDQMLLTNVVQLQQALVADGASLVIDGKPGKLTHAAVMGFQRAWDLVTDGVAGPRTQRTLAYVTATR